jgi:hypothetical protein
MATLQMWQEQQPVVFYQHQYTIYMLKELQHWYDNSIITNVATTQNSGVIINADESEQEQKYDIR